MADKFHSSLEDIGMGESYDTPEMLGWIAEVYMAFAKFLKGDGLI